MATMVVRDDVGAPRERRRHAQAYAPIRGIAEALDLLGPGQCLEVLAPTSRGWGHRRAYDAALRSGGARQYRSAAIPGGWRIWRVR